MLLITIILSSLLSFAETYTLLRFEPPRNNLAVIATLDAQKYSPGNEFVVETPQGACFLVVEKVVTDYIYVNTEQCQREYVSKGTIVAPRPKVMVERIITEEPKIIRAEMSTDSVTADIGYIDQEFYEAYIKNRLSATFSYLTGNRLDGEAQLNPSTSISDFRGSNTLSLGAEYFFWKLPYNLSLSAGAAYQLPRSYGRFQLSGPGASQVANFNDAAKIQTLSLFSNLRYHWNETTYAYFGLNHLFVNSSGFAGEMNGDFGFHLGGRYYVWQNLFADASFNFYNLDYEINNQKFDFSLSELEIKAGYTF